MQENSELKITALILLYKMKLDQCSTLLTLLKNIGADNLDVVVWDNGEASSLALNRLLAQQFIDRFSSFTVLGEGVNLPLSEVYNRIFTQAFSSGAADFVIMLDHDTELPVNYVQTLSAEYRKTEGKVLLVPQVRSKAQRLLVSPRLQKPYYFLKRYKLSCDFEGCSQGMYNSDNLFAVASGLAVPVLVWKQGLRFEERLRFYGIDTEFCADYSKLFKFFWLSEAELTHDISEEAVESTEVKEWRFEQHMDYWQFQLQKHSPYPDWFIAIFVACYRRLYRFKLRVRRYA